MHYAVVYNFPGMWVEGQYWRSPHGRTRGGTRPRCGKNIVNTTRSLFRNYWRPVLENLPPEIYAVGSRPRWGQKIVNITCTSRYAKPLGNIYDIETICIRHTTIRDFFESSVKSAEPTVNSFRKSRCIRSRPFDIQDAFQNTRNRPFDWLLVHIIQ